MIVYSRSLSSTQLKNAQILVKMQIRKAAKYLTTQALLREKYTINTHRPKLYYGRHMRLGRRFAVVRLIRLAFRTSIRIE